jgi:hypothetical protein
MCARLHGVSTLHSHCRENLKSNTPGHEPQIPDKIMLIRVNCCHRCTGIAGSVECSKQSQGWDIIPPVFSARVRTRQHFSFCYGQVEVRAKLPAGDWLFPGTDYKFGIAVHTTTHTQNLLGYVFTRHCLVTVHNNVPCFHAHILT